jgi:hypothetical protein
MNADEMMKFRIYPEEKRALEFMCQTDCRNKSAMLRELIREGARARGIVPLSILSDRALEQADDEEMPF